MSAHVFAIVDVGENSYLMEIPAGKSGDYVSLLTLHYNRLGGSYCIGIVRLWT